MRAIVHHARPRNVSLWNDMDRLFNNFFEDLPQDGLYSPRVDVREEEDRYLLEAEIPGLSENDVEVKVDDNLLTISSGKEEKKEQDEVNYLVRERKSLVFSRSFVLPKDVDNEKISGSFSNGILTLTMEKRPEAKPRQIKIG
ncbi:Hsp20/alpha crystallin family protein [Marispirochaeta sp.]|jgi:HSP20 family protein|uniref:Hsp20/alpha crystallin family protein n=1 Tax=Marispirochaeta sp. TaxID=2038653 RepID=UPI0029C802E6|nr:Hsp20/alpha crystallin family protein [Marispirochaeta sp.]